MYLLTSITWPHRGLRYRPTELECFFEVIRWQVATFQMIAGSSSIFKMHMKYVYTMMWMLRALWLVVAHDLLEIHGWRHGETCFLCFVQHGARFWKCLWDYFGLKQVKSSKKVPQKLFTRNKNGETGTKRALDYFRMPKLQEISAIVFHRFERLAVFQNVVAIILLCARKGFKKLFEETVYN